VVFQVVSSSAIGYKGNILGLSGDGRFMPLEDNGEAPENLITPQNSATMKRTASERVELGAI